MGFLVIFCHAGWLSESQHVVCTYGHMYVYCIQIWWPQRRVGRTGWATHIGLPTVRCQGLLFSGPLQIRTEVLKMLQALPIDLTDEQRKGQMKKSQIGHVVMFLSKPEVENNRSNRRIARVGAGFSSRCSPLHCVSPVAIARPCCKQLRVHAWKQRRSNCGPAYAFLLACQCLCSPPTFTCFGSSFRC